MDEIGNFLKSAGNVSKVIGDKGVRVDVAVRFDKTVFWLPAILLVSGVCLIFLRVFIENWLKK